MTHTSQQSRISLKRHEHTDDLHASLAYTTEEIIAQEVCILT